MSFPAYPEYKDSGVEWLGEVPAHWAVDRIKWSTGCCKNGLWGNEPQGDANDFPCVRVADFDRSQMRVVLNDPTIRNVGYSERAGRVLERGDLVLEKSGGGEKQPVGFVVLYDDNRHAICSNFTARVALGSGMDPSFWRYVHGAAYTNGLNVPSIKQTSGIQNLDQKSYLDERAAFPPLDEQRAIAHFLEHETVRIDALIEEQQRLIELLKEKRQAVISHAVTEGLDPDVPMKDSGVEWLGQVPAHWSVAHLKHTIREMKNGIAADQGKPGENTVAVSRIETISQGTIDYEKVGYVEYNRDVEPYRLNVGDILFSNINSLPMIGNCAIYEGRGDLFNGMNVLRLKPEIGINPWWLVTLLKSAGFRQEVESNAKPAINQASISSSNLKQLEVPIPPREEQDAICKYVNKEAEKLGRLDREARAGIEVLQERRSALISAAVTGKIDVRHWEPAEGSGAVSRNSEEGVQASATAAPSAFSWLTIHPTAL